MTAVISFPHILGHETVGTIEKVGPAVKGLSVGQRVVLNVKNGATSRDFSPDTVIETFVELGPRGPIPEASPRYPEAFTALKERIESYQRAAARAACGGSEQDKIGALAENPLIRSRAVAEAMWARAKSSYGKALE